MSQEPETQRRSDPLLRDILWDLLVTTAGFLLTITVVVLTLDALSIK